MPRSCCVCVCVCVHRFNTLVSDPPYSLLPFPSPTSYHPVVSTFSFSVFGVGVAKVLITAAKQLENPTRLKRDWLGVKRGLWENHQEKGVRECLCIC